MIALNKYGRKLYKELKQQFTDEQQEDIAFYTDSESDDTYSWHFVLGAVHHHWHLDKRSGKITK